jgi:hypothetical protein
MALFDTTKQSSIYPGLNPTQGVVDRSGLIDDSAISTLAGITKIGLEGAVELDRQGVVNEATATAEAFADDYLSRSPSEQAYLASEKVELESQLAGAPQELKPQYMKRLEDVEKRISNAQAQGIMSPYESARRITQLGQDLAAENPVYADEIASRINKTLQRKGLNDVLQADQKLLLAQQKRIEDRYNYITETIKDDVLDPYALTEEERYSKFIEVQRRNLNVNSMEKFIADKELLKTYSNADFMDKINQMGGFAGVNEAVFTSVTDGLKAIASNPNIKSFQERVDANRKILQAARNEYQVIVDRLPQDKEQTKTFIKNMEAMFTRMEKYADEDSTVEGLKKLKNNTESILKSDIQSNFYTQFGTTTEAMEALNMYFDVYNKAKGAQLLSTELEQKVNTMFSKFMDSALVNKNYLSDSEKDLVNDPGFIAAAKHGITILNKEQSPGHVNLVANYLKMLNDKDPQGEAASKVKGYDEYMKNIANINSDAFSTITNDNNMFSDELEEGLMQYNQLITISLKNQTDNKDVAINIDPRGMLRAPEDPVLDRELNRINTYIRIRAKMEGKDPKVIVKEVLANEFKGLEFNLGN